MHSGIISLTRLSVRLKYIVEFRPLRQKAQLKLFMPEKDLQLNVVNVDCKNWNFGIHADDVYFKSIVLR